MRLSDLPDNTQSSSATTYSKIGRIFGRSQFVNKCESWWENTENRALEDPFFQLLMRRTDGSSEQSKGI